MRRSIACVLAVMGLMSGIQAADDSPVGWRGNWTGRFPDATPPTSWERRSKSILSDVLYSARKPKGDDTAGALKPLSQSIVSWLILGPVAPKDPRKALDEACLPDEDALAPDEGDKAGELAWTVYAKDSLEQQWQRPSTRPHFWSGSASEAFDKDFSDGVDFGKMFPKGSTGVGYAHVYLYSPKAGAIELLLNHAQEMKIWLNGKVAYSNSQPVLSRPPNLYEFAKFEWPQGSPKVVRLDLEKGWNRLLCKVVQGGKGWCYDLRLTAPAGAGYETKNIVWETPLPSRGICNPIIVGDKVFITQEPDELTCLNKQDGKILWRRSNTFFDATPSEERAQNPLFKEIEPIAAQIQTAASYLDNLELHKQMSAILQKIDAKKYHYPELNWPHSNRAIGLATPNPCSDGKYVYVYFAHGVAACYDLEGNRKWIQLLADMVKAGIGNQSPALAGDKFIVQRQDVRAFDKATGKVLWTTVLTDTRCGSTVPAKVSGVDVVLVNFEQVLRCSDGKIIGGKRVVHHTTPSITENNTVVGGYDGCLTRWHLDSLTGDVLKTTNLPGAGPGVPADSLSSYLYYQGFVYMLDGKGILVVWEAGEEGAAKPAYSQSLGHDVMHPLYEPCEYGCCASPMLGGKNIYLLDNQGTTVIVEPGNTYKQVAVNRIENYLARPYITNTQERFYASPVCDGKSLFIRGDQTLYCIGEK